jgi:hypothetical protein
MSAELEEVFNEALDAAIEDPFAQLGEFDSTHEQLRNFQITEPAHADWALRKINAAERRIAETNELANAQIHAVMEKAEEVLAPVRNWHAQQLADNEETIRLMTALLNTYQRKVLLADPERKSMKLPHGVLSSRKGQPRWTFSDTFIEWANLNAPHLLRVKYEADANVAKAMLELDAHDGTLTARFGGEEVPGVEIEPAEVHFSVSTKTKDAE